jgi:Primase C terminal 1 (PriCT-1)/Bifunctional DNA primase/polymerase, N-terminal
VKSLFAVWQPRYAAHGVPLFPVKVTDLRKKPLVQGYLLTDATHSAQFALTFGGAESFGFTCGDQSRLTIVDMDSTDSRIIHESERLFGASPLIWRTGGGNYAAAYRHNGETRRIRPIRSLPIDLLGGGYCVAPPSLGTTRHYEIIKGNLADLDRLPMLRLPEELATSRTRGHEGISKGKRNDMLFRSALQQARYVDGLDALVDVVQTRNEDSCDEPLPLEEIRNLAASAWRYQQEGRNFIGGGGNMVVNTFDEIDAIAATNPDAYALLSILRRYHFGHDHFALANAMAEKLKWTLSRFRAARDCLVSQRVLRRVRKGGRGPGDVPLYRLD